MSGLDKPVYDETQLITALTTQDGTAPSLAWSTDIITYSINTGQIDPTHPEYTDEMSGHVAMTPAMEAAAREAFSLWDELIAVDLLEMDDWPSAHITFNYSSNTGDATYANFTYWLVDNDPRSQYKLADADIWLADGWTSQDEDSDLYLGGYALETYLHEIGHTLGLTHPGDYNGTAIYELDATHQQDTQQYSVMSYFEAGADGGGTDHIGTAGRSYGATPLLHDILAIQAIYGADMTTRTGDTTYGFNSTAGHGAYDFTVNINPVIAIWDAGGIDRIDASGWNTNQLIDLNAGAFSSVGEMTRNLAIAYGATVEQAVGGGGNDRLVGNAADNLLLGNAGADRLEGGDGNDIIHGGGGVDLIFGGAGNDTLEGDAGDDPAPVIEAASGAAGSPPDGGATSGGASGGANLGIENVSGSEWGDGRTGSSANDKIFGEDGNDTISGQSGNDFLLGGAGDDTIDGGDGNDILLGGPGADRLIGGSGEDWAQYNAATGGVTLSLATGGTGGDALGDTFDGIENVRGSRFADDLTGDAAGNRIMAGAGNDSIDGGGGDDVLFGEAGSDVLTGGGGNDMLHGGAGADVLIGGGGNDILEGHGGADIFVFGAGDGIDRINNFDLLDDLIRFDAVVADFGELMIADLDGDAAVTYGFGDVILLIGIDMGAVTAGLFDFV
jgi:serralysin